MKNLIKGLLIGLCIVSSSAFAKHHHTKHQKENRQAAENARRQQEVLDAIRLQQQIDEAIRKDNEAYKKKIGEQIKNDLRKQFPNANIDF